MKHLTKVALSASVMIVAAQAVSVSAKQVEGNIAVPKFEHIEGVSGLDVFNRADVDLAARGALEDIMTRYELDGETLEQRYNVAQNRDFVDQGAIGNPSYGYNVARCHSACHQDSGGYC